MRLPYSGIFRESGAGEDAEIAHCGISRAAMRYFFACADFPHTFWDNGARVEISDNERQLIEAGIAGLSRMTIGSCEMLVANLTLPNNQAFETNAVELPINFVAGTYDASFITLNSFPNGLTFNQPGLYTITTLTFLNGSATSITEFYNLTRTRLNGALIALADDYFVGGNQTLFSSRIQNVPEGATLNYTYQYVKPGSVTLGANTSRLQVFYHGP